MKYVYMIVDDLTCYGAWSDPREAARRWLGYRIEPDPDLDAESLIQADVTKMVEKLFDRSDNPMFTRVPVNPTGSPWNITIEGNMLMASWRHDDV